MDLSKRQSMILDLLLREGRESTLGRLASALGVSARTVHRELARLSGPLARDYGIVLAGRSGLGLSLEGSTEDLRKCREDLAQGGPRDVGPEDRGRMLALLLLDARDVLKTFALTSELGVSTAVARRDLEGLRPWFASHGLELVLRKGLGVRLEGPESRRRQAICSLIMEQLGETGLLALLGDEEELGAASDEPLNLIFRLVPAQAFREAAKALSGLPKTGMPALAPRDYLGLVVHLAVAALRRASGSSLEPLRADEAEAADEAGDELDFDVAAVARLCAAACARLGESLARRGGSGFRPAPQTRSEAEPAEAIAIERFLRGAKTEWPAAEILGSSIGSLAEVRALIDECSRIMGHDFSGDRVLRDGLAAHWRPAAYRLRHGLPIRNPLLQRIREEYGALFAAVRAACDASLNGLAVNDDEVGYLVLHFGSSMARQESGTERFRALVVCSAGIGSAHMLASRIRTELPEIDIVANLSWFDVREVPRGDWDLLVSTIPLPLAPDEYVLVDPLLSPEGLAALRALLARRRERARGSGATLAPVVPAGSAGAAVLAASQTLLFPPEHAHAPALAGAPEEAYLAELRQLSRHLGAVIGIIERLRVFSGAEPGDDWDTFLAAAMDRCALAGLVDGRDEALGALRERSRDHGILLPSSRVLFLHARGAGIALPSLSVHAFSGLLPAWSKAWEGRPRALALLLAPQTLDRETQDILNEISVSLLDARTVEVLHQADETSIRSHYSRYLERYFRTIPLQGA